MKYLVPLVLLLTGCVTASGWTDSPDYTPEIPAEQPLVDADGGFMYDGSSPYAPKRARAVGDLVTIRIVHDVQAVSNAGTKLARTSEVSANVSAMMGLEVQLEKLPDGGPTLGIGGGTTNDFTGTGNTTRQGSVSGTITARVVQVLPNGQLVVAARQAVMVNAEVEFLGIRGIVEPRSILADNSVLSTALADVRIEYTGQGVVAGKQTPGWLTRIFDLVTPL